MKKGHYLTNNGFSDISQEVKSYWFMFNGYSIIMWPYLVNTTNLPWPVGGRIKGFRRISEFLKTIRWFFQVYNGNSNGNDIVINDLEAPIDARVIRINPVEWQERISMRMELYGCRLPSRRYNVWLAYAVLRRWGRFHVELIYQTVFWRRFQILRRELKIRRVAEWFDKLRGVW